MHSQVLHLASPVFAAMLGSDMAEHRTKRIKVDTEVASFKEFKEFYKLLTPVRGRRVIISKANVDHLLRLSEYYQVVSVKDECAELLEQLPVSVSRLLQARTYQLQRQYKRCLFEISECLPAHKFDELLGNPDVMKDLLVEAQQYSAHVQKVLRSKSVVVPPRRVRLPKRVALKSDSDAESSSSSSSSEGE